MLQVTHLTCEYAENPLGLDEPRPRFSWRLRSDERGVTQAAYRLRVYREDEAEPVWDSGRVASRSCAQAEYGGPALTPRTRYRWNVHAWDARGRDSGRSEEARFETGLMSVNALAARWITAAVADDPKKPCPALRLRREFSLRGRVVRARAYASALGVYEMRINGKRVGDALLAPGWTSYHARVQYQTYDVTELLREGGNAVAATVADGWYRGYLSYKDNRNVFGARQAFLMELHVLYEDGGEDVIATDPSWKTNADGPIRACDYYMGLRYDARLETPGWDEPGYDEAAFAPAATLYHTRSGIVAQADPPVRRVRTVTPLGIIRTPKGETVLDMGQNMVGWPRFSLKGERGHTVTLRCGEVLDKDGNFYNDNYREAEAALHYTLRGGARETFEPDLTFFGFRYLRLENWPCEPKKSDFEGVVISSDLEETAGFECGDERVNQLFSNIRWSQRGNFVDVPTDCPQRDERLGWTGDCQVFARTACINMNCASMLSEWLKDLAADQRKDGAVPFTVPHALNPDCYGSSAWGDAAVVVPWVLYQCYGDLRVLRRQYDSMKSWMDYIRSQSQGWLWTSGFQFGDWLGLDAREGSYTGSTDKTLIATAFWAHDADLMAKIADALGYSSDAADYRSLNRNVVRAFRHEYVTPAGRLAVRTQTAHVLTLQFDLAEESHRPRLARDLVALVEEAGGHLTTGFVGTPYLCLALTACGAHDVAGSLLLKSDYPSWLYSVTRGATTTWEHWDGQKPDGSFWSRDMNSFNHYGYGSIGEWMMRALAGIDMLEPAYAKLILHPRPIEGISFVSAWQMTPYGRVRCEWRTHQDGLHEVTVRVPAGATALVVLEDARLGQVTEGERLLSGVDGIENAWQSEDDVMMSLGSGEYAFQWRTDGAGKNV